MSETTFTLEDGVSYSAGVAYIIKKGTETPKLFLILQKPGEKNEQRTGDAFIEKRVWKMPMGHFDYEVDRDIIDAAAREFEEETGFIIDRQLLSFNHFVSIRIPSERPDAEFHEDVFFLVITENKPKEKSSQKRDERTETVAFFPLSKLPTGTEDESQEAPISPGHRKKLARLFLRCSTYLEQKGIDVKNTLDSIAAPLRK